MNDVATLQALLHGRWNARDAVGFAALFTDDGVLIGFDGSTVVGIDSIADHLDEIFASHVTPTFVGAVRAYESVATDVILIRAIAGLVPPGRADIDPSLNAVQTIVATKRGGGWLVALLQNTPAAFHQDPEASAALTAELRGLIRRTSIVEP